MKRILEIPTFLKGKEIFDCYKCPFYDDGDGGYCCHCNIIELMENETIEQEIIKKYREGKHLVDRMAIIFEYYCPLSKGE